MLFPLFFIVEWINFCKSLPICLTINSHLIIISFPGYYFFLYSQIFNSLPLNKTVSGEMERQPTKGVFLSLNIHQTLS